METGNIDLICVILSPISQTALFNILDDTNNACPIRIPFRWILFEPFTDGAFIREIFRGEALVDNRNRLRILREVKIIKCRPSMSFWPMASK